MNPSRGEGLHVALDGSGRCRGPWLAGSSYSLADIAYSSYMMRLENLHMTPMIDARPEVRDWVDRLKARPSWEIALGKWVNPKYIALMDKVGPEAWETTKTYL